VKVDHKFPGLWVVQKQAIPVSEMYPLQSIVCTSQNAMTAVVLPLFNQFFALFQVVQFVCHTLGELLALYRLSFPFRHFSVWGMETNNVMLITMNKAGAEP
jgi:hypothetical protein